MTKRIFRAIITVSMTVLLACLVLATGMLYDHFSKTQASQLRDELTLAVAGVETVGESYFQGLDSAASRFTLVAQDGTVLYDTQAAATELENHGDREEIREALRDGRGSSARCSATLTERTLYEAVRLEDGTVLRIAVSRLTLGALLLSMLPAVAAVILIAVVVSIFLSDRMAKSIVRPLSRLDSESPAEDEIYEELAPILVRLRRQRGRIERQMALLRRKTDEFEQITASMNEGLILLDSQGTVLSINSAARRLFGIREVPVGRNFLTVDRGPEMSRAVEAALAGRHSEFREVRGGEEYQFIINGIESEGQTLGVVILCFDVTETAAAERTRREFTANVSHELKTPLQSIIGSAELLEHGLVKPEDIPRFVGNIRGEATRLVSLINDIIRLSQMDENGEAATETVELYAVASEVLETLTASAVQRQVSLRLSGEPCVMNGVRRYLYEIIYNLCDNAIRYNTEGGSVHVGLTNNGGRITLSVSDTGIGIPPEHQTRVFERFYRVDKSHSRETGGTGLGLSIVKHAVAYHGGTVRLDSTPGKGTTVTVAF